MASARLDLELSTGETSPVIMGAELLESWGAAGKATVQFTGTGNFSVKLQGSTGISSYKAAEWSDIGTFTQDDDAKIAVFDITRDVGYRISCTSGTNIRCGICG